MSLSNQARTNRNVELRTKENQIVTLYRQQKSDEEIATELHMAVPLVRATRDGMGLPPLRSSSGRLFTPEVDAKLLDMRERQGKSFRTIGEILGYMAMDTEVRYRILKRLQERAPVSNYAATIPCKICRKPFVSEDRRKVRFCLPCRTDVVPALDCSPYDPDGAAGCYTTCVSLPGI
jgi:hypothetical protein